MLCIRLCLRSVKPAFSWPRGAFAGVVAMLALSWELAVRHRLSMEPVELYFMQSLRPRRRFLDRLGQLRNEEGAPSQGGAG